MRAVELALALMAAPRGLDEVRARPLPDDMLAALKAAAGDPLTLADEALRHRCSDAEVQEACVIFVQQVLLAEGNDPFRTLGCAPDAPEEQLRQHYRWLQRWLHPDRDPEGWVSVFADRVTAAWNTLKRPDAREAVRGAVTAERPALLPVRRRPLRTQAWGEDMPDPEGRSWVVYLPHAVVGMVLLLAGAVYWADRRVEELAAVPGGVALAPSTPRPATVQDRPDAAPLVPSAATVTLTGTPVAPTRPAPVAEVPPAAVEAMATRVEDGLRTLADEPRAAAPVAASPEPTAVVSEPPVPVVPAPEPVMAVADARVAAPSPPSDTALPEVTAPEVVAEVPAEVSVATSVPAMVGPAAPAPSPRASTAGVPDTLPDVAPPVTVLFAFKGAYERGDLTGLMRLFAGDARTASGSWEQTWSDYGALFANTRERSLTLRDLRWERDGAGWVARGWLDAEVKREGSWFRQRSGGPVVLRFQPRAGTQRIVGWEQGGRG